MFPKNMWYLQNINTMHTKYSPRNIWGKDASAKYCRRERSWRRQNSNSRLQFFETFQLFTVYSKSDI